MADEKPWGVVAASSGYAFAFSGAEPKADANLKTLLELGLTSVVGVWARSEDTGKFQAFARYSGERGLMPLGHWPTGKPDWTRTLTVPLSTGQRFSK